MVLNWFEGKNLMSGPEFKLQQILSSADNLCKQFGPRLGPTKCRA